MPYDLEFQMSPIRFFPQCITAGAVALAVLLLLACGSDPEPTPTPAPTETPVPTPTPTVVPTSTPRPTATPTPTPEPAPARKSFIPEGATVIIDAWPSDVFDSSFVESALDLLLDGEGTVSGLFEDFQADTGIDPRSLEYLEAYADIGVVVELAIGEAEDSEPGLPELGIAVQGDIDTDGLAARLLNANDGDPSYEETSYRDYSLYVDARRDPDSLVFSIAEEGTLLFGTEEGVKTMLDVASGVAPQISGEDVRALEGLGNRDLGLILAIPEGLLDAATEGEDGSGNPMALLGLGGLTPEVTVMSLRFVGDSMQVHTVEIYEDDSIAASAKEYNEGTIAMVGSLFGSAEIQEMTRETEIEQEGNRVSYRLSVDESAMVAILDFIASFMALGEVQPPN